MLPVVEVSQSPVDKFREYLASRSRPRRFTSQQRDMVTYIFSKHNHFDADELIDEMKHEDLRVSRATVYRTLKELVHAGLLRKIDLGSRTVYEHDYGYARHDHLLCEKCGTMFEFQDLALESLIRDACQQNQFQYQGHTFVIRGVCASCHRARMTKRRLDLV